MYATSNPLAQQAAANLRQAVDNHKIVKEQEARFFQIRDFVKSPKNWILKGTMAHYAAFLLEAFLLVIPANLLFNVSGSNMLIWILGTIVVSICFMAILHFLITGGSAQFSWAIAREFQHQLNEPSTLYSINDLAVKRQNTQQKWITFGLLVVVVVTLAGFRAYWYNDTNGSDENDIWAYVISFAIAVTLMGISFATAPYAQIWKAYRREKRVLSRATNMRNQYMDRFLAVIGQVEAQFPKGDLLPSEIPASVQELLQVQEQFIGSGYDYSVLVPLQRQTIKPLFKGQLVPGLRVAAITPDNEFLSSAADLDGKAELSWKSYSPKLQLLMVGGKHIYDFQATDSIFEIELSDFDGLLPAA